MNPFASTCAFPGRLLTGSLTVGRPALRHAARSIVLSAIILAPLGAAAQNKLALAPTATYDNRYEVYGGRLAL